MIPGLLALLRALGVAQLDKLKQEGLEALKKALVLELTTKRDALTVKALSRLEDDVTALLAEGDSSWTDKDGVVMDKYQRFVHNALWAIQRTVLGGTVSDVIRDDHFASWGSVKAKDLLEGVTTGKEAIDKVWDALIEQIL